MTMNIFATSPNATDHTPDLDLGSLVSLQSLQEQVAPAPQQPQQAQPQQAPATDPNHQQIVQAVIFMRTEYWTQGKMTGQLLEQWQRIFAQLLNGARTAQEVSNCAHLADYAFVVGLRRQNSKAPK